MRKLIIAAAIVCAAAISQAAAVGWSAAGATGYSTYDMFVIGKNGVTGVDQMKAIVAAGGLDAASEYAFAEGTLKNGAAVQAANTSPYSITYSGSGTDNYTAFIFVEDAAGEQASHTSTFDFAIANNDTPKTLTFGNQASNYTANSFAVAPEPTSGLLLLLGVAGLALRRRRA